MFLTSFSRVHSHMSALVLLRSLDLSDIKNSIFCVIISDVRVINITSKPEACEPLDP